MRIITPLVHREAPDGGWGWAVVFGSFMLYVIGDGFSYTTGIFYSEFLKVYKKSEAITTLFDSIMTGMIYCAGPFASGLTSVYGCRKIAMLGSIVAAVGMLLSIAFDSIYTHCITLGFITGTGIGLLYLPQVVIVTKWFDKRLAFATGIALCGSGLGIALFALLSEKLIDRFGWKGTMLLLSGIMFTCVAFSSLFRDVPELQTEDEVEKSLKNVLKETFNFNILKDYVFLYFSFINFFIGTVYYVPIIYLKDHVIRTDIGDENDAMILMVVFGLSNAFSRALFGFIGDNASVNRLILFALSVIYYGLAIGLMAAYGRDYALMILCIIIYGSAEGAVICSSSVVIVDLFGAESVSNSFGIFNLIVGIAYFIGPPIISITFDKKTGYTNAFWISSLIIIMCGFLLLFLPIIHKKSKE